MRGKIKRRTLFGERVRGILIVIFLVAVGGETVFHFAEASVVDVDEIWGKGDSFTGEIGE
jgi:hypothetical protein